MKKLHISKLLCAVLFTAALIPAQGAFAASYDQQIAQAQPYEEFFQVSEQSNIIRKNISGQNLKRLKQVIMQNNNTTVADTTQMLIAMGYSERGAKMLDKGNFHDYLQQGSNITVIEKYIKTEIDGTIEIMEPEQCIEEAEREEALQQQLLQTQALRELKPISPKASNGTPSTFALHPNSGSNNQTRGYLRILTSAIYVDSSYAVNKNAGNYLLSASFEWLNTPSERYTDGLSIGINDFVWSDDASSYSADFEYDSNVTNGGSSSTYHEYKSKDMMNQNPSKYDENSLNVTSAGVYCGWNLPSNTYTNTTSVMYSNFIFAIVGVGRMRTPSTTVATAFNLYAKYDHLQSYLLIKPTLTWGVGGLPTVGFSSGVNMKHIEYSSLCEFVYDRSNDTMYK